MFRGKELEEEFQNALQTLHLMPGDELIHENSYVRAIPILKKGLLGVYRTEDEGREILLYYIQPGESCIMSFLAGINHDTSKVKAVAEEECEIHLVPVERVNEWIGKYPEWTDYIFKLYHRRFEELLMVVNSIAFQKMDVRILEQLKKRSVVTGNRQLSITHQQLADDVGTTREVVSRLLKQMEKEKLVRLTRNKIFLL
jgi:CRP/FNR family transcriptional regulator